MPERIPRAKAPTALLALSGVEAKHGETQVLWDIDLEVHAGEVVALIGANGAGKTTLMTTISGLLRPTRGSITFDGADIARAKPHQIVRRGVSQVPEGRQVFGNLDVEENLLIGSYAVEDKSVIPGRLESIFTMFPRLRERRRQSAATLSGGEQQMLAIGRGLMSGPRLLMLDEPSLGLAPVIVGEVFRALREVAAAGTTLLLVEQNSRLALRLADRAYVLETGHIALTGGADELMGDPRIQRLYLGQGIEQHAVGSEAHA